MKKRVLWESLAGCILLFVLLGIVQKLADSGDEDVTMGSGILQLERRENDTLWVYPGMTQEVFSPLKYRLAGEKNVISLCFSNLLSLDASGKKRNRQAGTEWTGKDQELSHISSFYDKGKKQSVITIELNPTAKTASGCSITADDLLFNYYLHGELQIREESLAGVSVLGMEEYRYGSKNLKKRRKEIKEYMAKPSFRLKKRWRKEIVLPQLKEEWEWVQELYHDAAYDFITRKYKKPKDLFAHYYAYKTQYTSKGKNASEVFRDILNQYQWRYRELAKVTHEKDSGKAEKIALEEFLKQDGKDTVSVISGIKKKDDRTLEITVKGREDGSRLCDIWVLPLSEYGDKKAFDGKTQFGFTRQEAAEILKKSEQVWNGTGPYYAASIGRKEICLAANQNYYAGCAAIKKIKALREGYENNREIVKALLSQEVDIVLARDDDEFNGLLANKATRASYAIRKIAFDTREEENCFLYRTGYVNVTTFPRQLSEYNTLFSNMAQIKVNH